MGIFDLLKGKSKVEEEPVVVKPETKSSNPTKKEPVIEVKSPSVMSKTSVGETMADIDGNVYTTVKIGKQVWTVENLKTTEYNDDTAIPFVTSKQKWSSYNDDRKPAYCWFDDDINNKERYGALYNWYAVDTGKLAPKGWHVPTDNEWTELEEYLIANGYNWDGSKEENKIAKALAAKTDWQSNNDSGTIGSDPSKNNASGFSALPGGFRNYGGYFYHQSSYGLWWSATENDAALAWYRSLHYDFEILRRSYYNIKGCGFSVRLVRDN